MPCLVLLSLWYNRSVSSSNNPLGGAFQLLMSDSAFIDPASLGHLSFDVLLITLGSVDVSAVLIAVELYNVMGTQMRCFGLFILSNELLLYLRWRHKFNDWLVLLWNVCKLKIFPVFHLRFGLLVNWGPQGLFSNLLKSMRLLMGYVWCGRSVRLHCSSIFGHAFVS